MCKAKEQKESTYLLWFKSHYAEKVRESLREQSEKEAKDMNLNSVKICFEAFVLQNEALYPICSPVYSRPIANQSKCFNH